VQPTLCIRPANVGVAVRDTIAAHFISVKDPSITPDLPLIPDTPSCPQAAAGVPHPGK
jgi:hypothetical protein